MACYNEKHDIGSASMDDAPAGRQRHNDGGDWLVWDAQPGG